MTFLRICTWLWAVSMVLLLLCAPASAWGPIGHMTVAYVAYQNLTPAAKARVHDLLKLNPDYASWEKQIPSGTSSDDRDLMLFMIASVWADDIKGEPQYSDDGTDDGNTPDGASSSQNVGYSDHLRHKYWHFIDTPFSPDQTPLPAIPAPNAQRQIVAFRAVLGSSQPDELKSYDLVWLLHLVGDIHQPLHAVTRVTQAHPKGDAGANSVKLFGDGAPNLHSYWDGLPGSDCKYCNDKIMRESSNGACENTFSNLSQRSQQPRHRRLGSREFRTRSDQGVSRSDWHHGSSVHDRSGLSLREPIVQTGAEAHGGRRRPPGRGVECRIEVIGRVPGPKSVSSNAPQTTATRPS